MADWLSKGAISWPRGLMDKASDFGSEDCEFESRRGQNTFERTTIKNATAGTLQWLLIY